MKDNISLIAAAAGGFMLSVALAGILRGSPVVSWQGQSSVRLVTVANSRLVLSRMEKVEFRAKNRNG